VAGASLRPTRHSSVASVVPKGGGVGHKMKVMSLVERGRNVRSIVLEGDPALAIAPAYGSLLGTG
jgi:hypothetical protein